MNLYLDALATIRRSFAALIAFEIMFKLLTVIVLAPVSAAILYRLIAASGTPAIANEEIIAFLLSLVGILTLAALGTFFFTIVFVEQAGLLLLLSTPVQEQRVTFLAALLRTGALSHRLVRLGLLQFAGYLLVLSPFVLAALMTYRLLLTDHDINFYLANRPPQFWTAVGIGAILALCAVSVLLLLFVRWLFSLPLLVLGHKGVLTCMRESARLARRFFWSAAPPLALWFVLMFAILTVGGWLLSLTLDPLMAWAGNHPRWVVTAVALLLALHLAGGIAWTFALFAGTCALVLGLYRRACERANLPVVAPGKPLPDRALSSRERWSLRGVLWLGAAVLVALSVASALALVESVDVPVQVQITAHRGGSRQAPENTLSAFAAAIQMRADFAELDVQQTADGVLVVLHDADLMRVAGVKKKIWQVTYQELKNLEAGSWFSTKFRGEPIPTLEQVIDLAADKLKLNIELKYNHPDPKLAGKAVDLLARKHFDDRCVITSLKYGALLEVKKLNPRLKTGLIVAKAVGPLAHLPVDFFSVNISQVSRAMIQSIHAAGKQIHVWTVNDPKQMEAMIELRVDNLITDFPEKAREILEQRQELSNSERLLLALHQRLKED